MPVSRVQGIDVLDFLSRLILPWKIVTMLLSESGDPRADPKQQ